MIRVTSGIGDWFTVPPESQQIQVDNQAQGILDTAIRSLQEMPPNSPMYQQIQSIVQQLMQMQQ